VVTIGLLSVCGDAVTRYLASNVFDPDGFSDRVPVLWASIVYTALFSALGG
jgi:hypothetical protein